MYNYKCDLCDVEYVGYTRRHLHQRIDEHRYSAISKHLKNDHGLKFESGRVIEVVVPPLVVNPLSVSVQATGKKKLILDLRYLNKCLRKMRQSNMKTGKLLYPTS